MLSSMRSFDIRVVIRTLKKFSRNSFVSYFCGLTTTEMVDIHLINKKIVPRKLAETKVHPKLYSRSRHLVEFTKFLPS